MSRNILLYSRNLNVPHGQAIGLFRRPGKKSYEETRFLSTVLLKDIFKQHTLRKCHRGKDPSCDCRDDLTSGTVPTVTAVTSSSRRVQVNWVYLWKKLTHCGRVMQICVFTLQLCRTGDANLRF
jgi:hypothetical protein